MIRRRKAVVIRLLIAAVIFGLCFLGGQHEVFSPSDYMQPSLILDAGHGGEDGGAVSVSGVKESMINLEIVLRMDQILGLLGEQTLLMRKEDISLHDDQAETLREKKVSDLKYRVETVNSNPDATLVSIHQNTFQDSKYRGMQVFYAPTDHSQLLAQKIQERVKTVLQHENNRQSKQIPDSIYLMSHIRNRAVLIECGFLTNPEEAALLQQATYQCKLALVIASALME